MLHSEDQQSVVEYKDRGIVTIFTKVVLKFQILRDFFRLVENDKIHPYLIGFDFEYRWDAFINEPRILFLIVNEVYY